MIYVVYFEVRSNLWPVVHFFWVQHSGREIGCSFSNEKVSLFLFVLKLVTHFGFKSCIFVKAIIMPFFAFMVQIWIYFKVPLIWWSLKSRLFPLSLEKSQVLDKSCFWILKLVNCLSSSTGFILIPSICYLEIIFYIEKLFNLF